MGMFSKAGSRHVAEQEAGGEVLGSGQHMSHKVIVREWVIEIHDYQRKDSRAYDFAKMPGASVSVIEKQLRIRWTNPDSSTGEIRSQPGTRFAAMAPLIERRLAIPDIASRREASLAQAAERDRNERLALERAKATAPKDRDGEAARMAAHEQRRHRLIWGGALAG